MAAKMKSMKKLITGESFTLPAALDCGENQLNAALSMEAGSRSPLPPSPNHPSSPDIDSNSNSNTMSHASMRGFNSMESSLTISAASLAKSTPQKPPRINFVMNMEKAMGKIDENQPLLQPKPPAPPPQRNKSIMQNYESILDDKDKVKQLPSLKIHNNNNNNNIKSPELPARNIQLINKSNRDRDYECIENITDAWKTMGIDNIKHTENCTTPEEELVDFIFNHNTNKKRDSNSNKDNPQQQGNYVTTQKMLKSVIEIDSAGNYDRLEFFGPQNKKKSTPSSSAGYKTIVPINNILKPVSITDDYEFIGDPDEKLVHPNTSQQATVATLTTVVSATSTGLETCRLADDSYLGYGVLRKTQHTPMITAEDDEQLLHHQQHNGLNYAIVSKPKRV
jgi:docking protein 2